MSEHDAWLRKVSLFAPLSDAQLYILGRTMVLQELPPGHVFMTQGHGASSDMGLFVLRSGSITVSVRKPKGGFALVRTLAPGEIFGVIGLIDPDRKRTATVVAGSSVEVAHLTRTAFLSLFHAHSQLACTFQLALARQLVDDLRKTDEALRAAMGSGSGVGGLPSRFLS